MLLNVARGCSIHLAQIVSSLRGKIVQSMTLRLLMCHSPQFFVMNEWARVNFVMQRVQLSEKTKLFTTLRNAFHTSFKYNKKRKENIMLVYDEGVKSIL